MYKKRGKRPASIGVRRESSVKSVPRLFTMPFNRRFVRSRPGILLLNRTKLPRACKHGHLQHVNECQRHKETHASVAQTYRTCPLRASRHLQLVTGRQNAFAAGDQTKCLRDRMSPGLKVTIRTRVRSSIRVDVDY